MGEKLLDQTKRILPEDVFQGLVRAWQTLLNETPKKESICILMAQSALETGRWKAIHCFNFGNIKSSDADGLDYTFYACNELMPIAMAKQYAAKSPDTAKITAIRNDGKAWIWFYPDHPASRFRAFKTLDEGALDYLGFLFKKYRSAWQSVVSGDPTQFSHQLKIHGYYTADEASYTKGVVNIFREFMKLPYDPASVTFLTEETRQKLDALIALTTQQMVDEIPIIGQADKQEPTPSD
jgi:hypothetical protein